MEQKQNDPEPLGRQRKPKRKHAKVAQPKAADADAGTAAPAAAKSAEFGASEWDVDANGTGEQAAGSTSGDGEQKSAAKKPRRGSDAGSGAGAGGPADGAADGGDAKNDKKKKKKKVKKVKKGKKAKKSMEVDA